MRHSSEKQPILVIMPAGVHCRDYLINDIERVSTAHGSCAPQRQPGFEVAHHSVGRQATTAMYIRWQTRRHRAIILVENVRVDGRPRQKHVAYLAGFDERRVNGRP
jgi:hypothetical protein